MTTHTGSSVTESERSITSAQLAYKLVNDASSATKTYGCIQCLNHDALASDDDYTHTVGFTLI